MDMDMRLEVVLPAADVQRAEAFYEALGWRMGPDSPGEGDFRVVQLTPLASPEDRFPETRPADPAWLARAACRWSVEPDLFFPVSHTGSSIAQVARAKAICMNCSVRRECLTMALRTRQLHGIWGGMTEQERSRMVMPADRQRTDSSPLGPRGASGESLLLT